VELLAGRRLKFWQYNTVPIEPPLPSWIDWQRVRIRR